MKYYIYCRKSTDDDSHQVISIESQRRELRTYETWPEVSIHGRMEESRSARVPGRPRFNEMMDSIERGEADGIIAWHPDRLARNALDAGRVIDLLDRGLLKDLKFPTLTFENSPMGKFMLMLAFTQGKYQVDNLSENVKRGNRTKVQMGWLPNMPGTGYINDPVTRTIVSDPARFHLVRRMWDLLLTGAYSPFCIWRIATYEWGLRTRVRKRTGGGPLSLSAVYKLFASSFYAGLIVWEGKVYPGKHERMVTLDEFNRAQEILRARGKPQPQKHRFPYTGLIRCGECGLSVTAEEQVNRFGSHYVYYHCTKRRGANRCGQPYLRGDRLEEQLADFIGALVPHPEYRAWVHAARETQDLVEQRAVQERSRAEASRGVQKELASLRQMRLRELISDAEFLHEQRRLKTEELRLADAQQDLESRLTADPFEPMAAFDSFSSHAASWLRAGDVDQKRLIAMTACSNLTLRDEKLSVSATIPFVYRRDDAPFPQLYPGVQNIRTLTTSPEFQKTLELVRKVLDRQRLGQPSSADAGEQAA